MAKKNAPELKKEGTYSQIIRRVFASHYRDGVSRFTFQRDELITTAEALGIDTEGDRTTVTKNLGDIVYSFRFRRDFPPEINRTAPAGKMWIIVGKGDAAYEFRLITTFSNRRP